MSFLHFLGILFTKKNSSFLSFVSKGSHDALEVSFTALLDEEASHEHDAANAAANANANLASTSNAPSSLAHGETPEEAHKREHDAKMAATKAKQAAAEEASGGQVNGCDCRLS